MITQSFDPDPSPIITPEAFYGPRRYLVNTCLVTYSNRILSHVLSAFPCRLVAEMTYCTGKTPIYTFEHAGKTFAIYLSRMGGACAGADIVESNWLTGATHFIMFGSAGNLDSKMPARHYVVPTHACRDEGLSYHYAPAADYIAVSHAEDVAAFFEQEHIPYVKGRVWTTDAFYRETRGAFEKRVREGCIAVDMELAGIQAVCDFHGFELYDFLETGDDLTSDDYEKEELVAANHDTEKLHLALKLALLL